MFGISGVVIVFMASDKQSFDKLKFFSTESCHCNIQYFGFCHLICQKIYVESLSDPRHNSLYYGNTCVTQLEEATNQVYPQEKKANMKQVTPKYHMGGEELGEEMPRLQHPAFGS